MSKVTTHICDFNPNLAQHTAHFTGTVNGSEMGLTDFDVCAGHVAQFIAAKLGNPNIGEVKVQKIKGVVIPAIGSMKGTAMRGQTPNDDPCPVCGQESRTKQGLATHIRKAHNMTMDEASIHAKVIEVNNGEKV